MNNEVRDALARVIPKVGALSYSTVHDEVVRRAALAARENR